MLFKSPFTLNRKIERIVIETIEPMLDKVDPQANFELTSRITAIEKALDSLKLKVDKLEKDKGK